jgi:hypothetical protein
VGSAKRDGSFYQTLSEVGPGGGVITFNYTDFFCNQTRPGDGYFHGDCRSYIRWDTRELIENDDKAEQAITPEETACFISGLSVDWDKDRVYLPGIVPPLSVKPIICSEYLDRWYGSSQKIRNARQVAIIGYSFNVADEHFNDLIRKGNKNTKLVVVNPDIEPVIPEVCRICGVDRSQLSQVSKVGLNCWKGGTLTFAAARAEALDASTFMSLLSL